MSAKAQAQAAKARGNTAFAQNDFLTAISEFSLAIELDPSDHVFFSNRSGAYASLQQYEEALEDAVACIKINPNWSKGYTRKGCALLGLNRYDEAAEAYKEGLRIEPGNSACAAGLTEVENARPRDMPDLFGPSMWGKLAGDPVTREYLKDPSLLAKLERLQKEPKALQALMGSDHRIATILAVIMGLGSGFAGANKDDNASMRSTASEAKENRTDNTENTTTQTRKTDKRDRDEFEGEDDPELASERRRKKQSVEFKDKGNEYYKHRDFSKALEMYDKALELDPENVALQTNKAAVLFEQKDYEACEKLCQETIQAATATKGYDFRAVAKAHFRLGNAQDKLNKLDEAIASYKRALLEDPLPAASAALKKVEARKKKLEEEAYLDPAKAEEHKTKGNDFFAQGKWTEAIQEYTESLRRDPSNHRVYSNRAACYAKHADWARALEDCDKCLAIDPKFVKAYIRKGKIQHLLKQYHKALETFQRGLDLDPTASELIEGKKLTMAAINQENASGQVDPARQQEAMKDPEIRAILQDPLIHKVLEDMQSDPASGARALSDPGIRTKIEKLVAAGVLQVASR